MIANTTRSRHCDPDRDVSYEEYHPYGTTAWKAPSLTTVSLKRYKYTGMERDEETGLQRHGVRYYATWLGRWTSADPIGLGDGVNRFGYCHGGPIGSADPTGLAPAEDATPGDPPVVAFRLSQPIDEAAPGNSSTDADTVQQALTSYIAWYKAAYGRDLSGNIKDDYAVAVVDSDPKFRTGAVYEKALIDAGMAPDRAEEFGPRLAQKATKALASGRSTWTTFGDSVVLMPDEAPRAGRPGHEAGHLVSGSTAPLFGSGDTLLLEGATEHYNKQVNPKSSSASNAPYEAWAEIYGKLVSDQGGGVLAHQYFENMAWSPAIDPEELIINFDYSRNLAKMELLPGESSANPHSAYQKLLQLNELATEWRGLALDVATSDPTLASAYMATYQHYTDQARILVGLR